MARIRRTSEARVAYNRAWPIHDAAPSYSDIWIVTISMPSCLSYGKPSFFPWKGVNDFMSASDQEGVIGAWTFEDGSSLAHLIGELVRNEKGMITDLGADRFVEIVDSKVQLPSGAVPYLMIDCQDVNHRASLLPRGYWDGLVAENAFVTTEEMEY